MRYWIVLLSVLLLDGPFSAMANPPLDLSNLLRLGRDYRLTQALKIGVRVALAKGNLPKPADEDDDITEEGMQTVAYFCGLSESLDQLGTNLSTQLTSVAKLVHDPSTRLAIDALAPLLKKSPFATDQSLYAEGWRQVCLAQGEVLQTISGQVIALADGLAARYEEHHLVFRDFVEALKTDPNVIDANLLGVVDKLSRDLSNLREEETKIQARIATMAGEKTQLEKIGKDVAAKETELSRIEVALSERQRALTTIFDGVRFETAEKPLAAVVNNLVASNYVSAPIHGVVLEALAAAMNQSGSVYQDFKGKRPDFSVLVDITNAAPARNILFQPDRERVTFFFQVRVGNVFYDTVGIPSEAFTAVVTNRGAIKRRPQLKAALQFALEGAISIAVRGWNDDETTVRSVAAGAATLLKRTCEAILAEQEVVLVAAEAVE